MEDLFVKHTKRFVSVLLAMVLALGLALPAQAAAVTAPPQGPLGAEWAVDTEHPVIIVHGIGQSEVFLYDEAGEKVIGSNGKPVQGWPLQIDINALIPKLIFPALASLLLQSDIFLTKTARKLGKEVLNTLQPDDTGRPVQNMQVERWHRYDGGDPTSLKDLATLAPEQRDRAYNHIPLQEMSDLVGEQLVYYFAYDSLGNLEDIVDELYQLIQDLLKKHGTDKVTVIPISLGGVIMNGLIEYHKADGIMNQLNNVVFVIAALDGSNIAGDVIAGQLALDNESLYRTMLPSLVEGYLGYLLNVALRLLPKRLVKSVVDAVLDGVVGDVAAYCTMLWGLVPQSYYAQASAKWLSDPKMAKIKAQTDRYYNAQVNSRKNILDMKENAGVNVYAIVDYNFPMYSFVASASKVNSDGLLQVDSPSMGGTSLGVNVPLPADYVPKKPGYMDEGRIVDASTGILPDHTWYFKDQDHERTGKSDVVMRLALRLACGAQKKSITSMPEWPQFNYGRDGRHVNNMLRQAKEVDRTALSAEDKAALDAATALMREVVEDTIVNPEKEAQAERELRAIMEKIGAWKPPEQPSFWTKAGEKICWFLSEALYFAYGARGFIDPFWVIWTR